MEQLLHNSLIAIIFMNYISFAYSVIGVFRKTSKEQGGLYFSLQILSLSFWTYSGYLLITKDHFNSTLLPIVLIAQIGSFALFWYTSYFTRSHNFSLAFHQNSSTQLITTGPFQMIRNPFYTSYLSCYFTTVLLLADIPLCLIFVLLFAVYFKATNIEESFLMTSTQGKIYLEYFKSTKKFIPHLF